MKRREFMTLLAGAAAVSSVAGSVCWPYGARAQQPSGPAGFPNKTLRIIVPFTPGGSNDVVAREIATGLQASSQPDRGGREQAWRRGQHRVFLCGEVAAGRPCHADRAGLVHHGPASVAQSGLQPGHRFRRDQSGRRRARSSWSFRRACRCGRSRSSSSWRRSSPNKLSFGSVGVGTPQHLGGELFKMHAGVDLVHVPFRGATAALPDLLAGASTCSSARSIRCCR